MNVLPILIISPDRELFDFLRQHLPDSKFECRTATPWELYLQQAKGIRIAVVDRINQRPDSAPEEIAQLKEYSPGLPVIALSEHSTGNDAAVVRQGLFYYLTGPPGPQLIRVIHAAANTLESDEPYHNKEKSKPKEYP